MNHNQIADLIIATSSRLSEVRSHEKEKGNDTLVGIASKQDSIPRELFLDTDLSAGACRAFGVLTGFCPTPFPGIRTLATFLGGVDGAVRTTDELFLFGWHVKQIVKRGKKKQQAEGTIYILFPKRKTPVEMAGLEVGWLDFVVRLAKPSHGKKDKKAVLRRAARKIIEENPGLFPKTGVFPISDSENVSKRFIEEEGLFEEENNNNPVVVDGAIAPENQNLDWPENLICSQSALLKIMKKIPAENRQSFINEISNAAEDGKIKSTIPAYAAGMIRNGWLPSPKVEEDSRSTEIEAQIESTKQAVSNGQKLFIDGEPASLESGLVRLAGSCESLAVWINRGANIETRQMAA